MPFMIEQKKKKKKKEEEEEEEVLVTCIYGIGFTLGLLVFG